MQDFSDNLDTPYAQLSPDVILTALESVGLACSGSLLALNSFENRVYQVGVEEAEPVIAKFYRPKRWSEAAILEEHQFAAELVAHEIPVVAPLELAGKTLHHFQEYRFAVFPRQGGRALELDNLDQLEWMGRFVGRLHAVGACGVFTHRLHLTVQSYGYTSYQFLIENNFIPGHLRDSFCQTVEAILKKSTQIFQDLGSITPIRLHGDCHAGNVLWRDSGPHIVDLDDCLMGPAVQDIWMLLSGDVSQHRLQLDAILEGYNQFHDFNLRELRLIEVMRTLRLLHYAAWLARRWEDPAFPRSFPWFNTGFYWQELLQDLVDQVMLLEQATHDVFF